MYAIVDFGGRQYKMEEGQTIYTEKVNGVEVGGEYSFDKVLFVKTEEGLKIGQPFVEGAKVVYEVVEHGRDEKILVVKFKGRKNYRRRQGHRQHYTAVKIKKIEL